MSRFILLFILAAWSVHADSRVLDEVLTTAQVPHPGRRALVIFDLDGTVLDTNSRTLRIFREFTAIPEIQARYPEEARRLRAVRMERIPYKPETLFPQVRITNPEFIARALEYWKPRFFSSQYSQWDLQIRGAADYVARLWRAGADIVYLTGRPLPEMGTGTLEALRRQGFPYPNGPRQSHSRAWLFMKPTAAEDDLVFKRRALGSIARMGDVIAAFENEPRNANLFSEVFPRALTVFVYTTSSESPSILRPGTPVIRDFWRNSRGTATRVAWLPGSISSNENSDGSPSLR